MEDMDTVRVLLAIGNQNSPTQSTESGAMITLLGQFAREKKFTTVAEAFQMYAAARPANAPFVAGCIPAKILNLHLLADSRVKVSTFEAWQASPAGRDWPDRIKQGLHFPSRFESIVNSIFDELLAWAEDRVGTGRSVARPDVRSFRFTVRQIERDGAISWEAMEDDTGRVIALGTTTADGAYPEIEDYLLQHHGIDEKILFLESHGDRLDGQKWTFVRPTALVIVKDIPRTILRVSAA